MPQTATMRVDLSTMGIVRVVNNVLVMSSMVCMGDEVVGVVYVA